MTWLTFFPAYFVRIGTDLVVPHSQRATSRCLAFARLRVLQSTPALLFLHVVLSICLEIVHAWHACIRITGLKQQQQQQQQQQKQQQQQQQELELSKDEQEPDSWAARRVFHTGEFVRTSEDRFHGVAQMWPEHVPQYLEYAGLRVHYLDACPKEAGGSSRPLPTVVLCHGQLTWSIQYRQVVPALLGAGYRVVALDFVGHGRSDKLLQASHTMPELHMDVLAALMEELQLQGVTLVLQGCLGAACCRALHILPEGRLQRLVLLGVPCPLSEVPLSLTGLRAATWCSCWASLVQLLGCYLPVTLLVLLLATRPNLTMQEAAAYGAPYPSVHHKAGLAHAPGLGALPCCSLAGALQQAARALGLMRVYCHLPALQSTFQTYFGSKEVGLDRGLAQVGRMWLPYNWHGPTLVLVGRQDPLSGLCAGWFQGPLHPDCLSYCNQPKVVAGAGHCLVEDAPLTVAQELHALISST